MTTITKKIDFIGFITVNKANPNGDPLNGNQPRTDYDGYGEISDVCLKRKLRNRLQDVGEKVLVQSDERSDDGYDSIRSRVEGNADIAQLMKGKDKDKKREFFDLATKTWVDVRSFGQVFAFKKGDGVDSVSQGVRGPVSIHTAVSIDPVLVSSMQITKSVNGEPGEKRGSDTMGMKHRVDFGIYKLQGSINVQLAEKTKFSDEDATKIKQALVSLFDNDASSARPEGSVTMTRVYWVEHATKSGNASSYVIHNSVQAKLKDGIEMAKKFEDYNIVEQELYNIEGISVEKYENGQLV